MNYLLLLFINGNGYNLNDNHIPIPNNVNQYL